MFFPSDLPHGAPLVNVFAVMQSREGPHGHCVELAYPLLWAVLVQSCIALLVMAPGYLRASLNYVHFLLDVEAVRRQQIPLSHS